MSVVQNYFFLKLPDVELDEYYNPLPDSEKAGAIVIQEGTFHWGETNFILSSINLHAQQVRYIYVYFFFISEITLFKFPITTFLLKGKLIAVTGPVGSGKSSLLAAILAELEKCSGSVACADYDQGILTS